MPYLGKIPPNPTHAEAQRSALWHQANTHHPFHLHSQPLSSSVLMAPHGNHMLSQGPGWQDVTAASPPRTAHFVVPCRGVVTALRFLAQHLLLSYLHIKGMPYPYSGIHLGNNLFPGVAKERLLCFQYQYFIKLYTPRRGVCSPIQSVDTFVWINQLCHL